MNKFGIAEIYRRGFSAGLAGLTSKPEDSGHWVSGFNDGYASRPVFHHALNKYLLAQGLEPMSEIKTQEEVAIPAPKKEANGQTQMTLGQLIARLKEFPPEAEVVGFRSPHSYRGYYTDLALECTGDRTPVKKLVEIAENVVDEIFSGYKGGDYYMTTRTLVWLADYGNTGKKILGLKEDGTWDLSDDIYK